MPNLAWWHPQIVYFAIALVAIGVLFRWISLSGRAAFTGPAAATLLLAGALAAVLAAHSGLDAHGPVERIPGVRAAVMEHEEWGRRTRNLFLIVAALEVTALALAGRPGGKKGLLVASAIVGLAHGGGRCRGRGRGGAGGGCPPPPACARRRAPRAA